MTPTLDRRSLALVCTVDQGEGRFVRVHATPISRDVFQRYFLAITRTYAAMQSNGPEWVALCGAQVAGMMLRRVAEADGSWDDLLNPDKTVRAPGVRNGLVAEIRRLATAMVCSPSTGWEMLPLDAAVTRGALSAEEAEEVESAITFFTVFWTSLKREDREGFAGIFGEQVTSLSASEFLSSLTTSTRDESSGEKATPSPIAL